jgi:hypothetical protein
MNISRRIAMEEGRLKRSVEMSYLASHEVNFHQNGENPK